MQVYSLVACHTGRTSENTVNQQEEQTMKQVINWFEIPADDFDRAVTFYENVFATKLRRVVMNVGEDVITDGVFPYEPPAPSGSICKRPNLQPGPDGTLIYLDASPDISEVLARVWDNGGKVVLDKTLVTDDIGYIGVFIDSEGNRVGVHARK